MTVSCPGARLPSPRVMAAAAVHAGRGLLRRASWQRQHSHVLAPWAAAVLPCIVAVQHRHPLAGHIQLSVWSSLRKERPRGH